MVINKIASQNSNSQYEIDLGLANTTESQASRLCTKVHHEKTVIVFGISRGNL